MAKYKLLLPKMGESVEEATIIKWTKNPGDYIEADETVMEIATDKVDSDVPSPVSGKLVERFYKDNDVVKVGAIIAIIETNEPEEVKEEPVAAPASTPAPQPPVEETKQIFQQVQITPPPTPVQPEIKQEEVKQPVFAEPRKDEPVPFTEQLGQKAEDEAKNGLR